MAVDVVIDLGALEASEGYVIYGDAVDDRTGDSVSAAGDINGDGIGDLIIGSPRADIAGYNTGSVYVVYGKEGSTRGDLQAADLAASDGFTIYGYDEDGRAGFSVTGGGDINHDGYDDLVIGAPRADDDTSNKGEVYVIFGKDGGLAGNIDLGNLSSTDGFKLVGDPDYNWAGGSVYLTDDINGDGIDDLLIGANGVLNEAATVFPPGRVYVIFGKDGATRDDIDLAELSASNGFSIRHDDFGGKVAPAGDVNGDGLEDVIVAIPGEEYNSNKVYVVFGKVGAARPNVELTSLSADDGFSLVNSDEESRFGGAVSSAGDINGDGYDDIIIGDNLFREGGRNYIIFGKEDFGSAPLDVASLQSGDGFYVELQIPAETDARSTFGQAAFSAGDINHDGFDDIVLGSYYPDDTEGPDGNGGATDSGDAYVIFGKSGETRGNIDLTSLSASDGFQLMGAHAWDYVGFSAASADDINGDGIDDLIVGAPFVHGSAPNPDGGEAYVIYGRESFGVPNEPPVALPATAEAVEDGPLVTGQLEASDPDGDALTFSPILTGQFAPGVAGLTINVDGSYSFDPSDPEYQSLAEGEVVDLLGGYFVSDGTLTDSSTLTITITGVNDAPVAGLSPQSIVAMVDTAKDFTASATDVDGDALTYGADDPDHGTVTGGTNGEFTYTPDAGYLGSDTVTVTISDGHGGSAMQSFHFIVNPPLPGDFRMFTSDGYVGEIGGSGQVFGTAGFQDITVLDVAGNVALDPSFNKGGDIVRLSGNAGDWGVVQSGSVAIFSDGDTFVQIPAGTAGTSVVFDDGVRSLRFDIGEGSLKIGAQAFGTELVQITAPTDGSPLPTGAEAEASARLFLGPDKSATAGGHLDVFGTSGAEQITITHGEVSLDPSFNKGGDTLVLGDPAPDFLASRSGSTVLLDGATTDVVIPVGLAGMTIAFPGDDERTLLFDAVLNNPVIGSQEIDTTPTALAAFG